MRLHDYIQAVRFYLLAPDTSICRLVLVDNSASDISQIARIAHELAGGREVEIFSYSGLDYPVQQGRSVGETRLIDYALRNSSILSELGESDLFWKITGRLRIRNIGNLIRSTPPSCSLYADFRRYPRRWVDTRMFATTPSAFRRLFLSRVELMRQDLLPELGFTAPEERLFGELFPERLRERITPRLRYEPLIDGYSGFDDDYGRLRRRAWSSFRSATRRLVPSLWI